MAVMMVAENVANTPKLFGNVRFLTTAVASEMSYSSGLQRQALFSIALVLFLFIMAINLILNGIIKKGRRMTDTISKTRKIKDSILSLLMFLSAGLICALLMGLIGYILYRGIPHISWINIVTTKDVNLWYGASHALKNINMQIPEKEITALIGPSACGKSTYLKPREFW